MSAASRRLDVLELERPIAEREARLEVLRATASGSEGIEAVRRLEAEVREETAAIFSNLSPWQVTQVARHPQRPYTLDYLERMCSTFVELHGDRAYADDRAMVGGLARIEGRALVVVGHQKGRDTKEKIRRQFGMPNPEGYRKALRLMKLAERFRLPVLCLIDTPGAYPGIGAEERGQSEAIARNLVEMARLRSPVVCAVIGEGGSGGAPRDRGRRPGADARAQRLLRHFARGMRLHPVEEGGGGAPGPRRRWASTRSGCTSSGSSIGSSRNRSAAPTATPTQWRSGSRPRSARSSTSSTERIRKRSSRAATSA